MRKQLLPLFGKVLNIVTSSVGFIKLLGCKQTNWLIKPEKFPAAVCLGQVFPESKEMLNKLVLRSAKGQAVLVSAAQPSSHV